MKSRKPLVYGGVLAAAVAVGVMISDWFKGLGPGGAGTGSRVSLTGSPDAEQNEVQPPEEIAGTEQVSADANPPPLQPGDVLNIVIDGRSYAIRQVVGDEERLYPVELSEIARLAREAPGNNEGIKVRIFRKESSLPTAEQALDRTLTEAGLTTAEVLQTEELLK